MNIRGSIVFVVVAMLIISALAIFLIYDKPNEITALKAVELSDVPAKEWNENAKLISVDITDYFANPNYTQVGYEGHYNEWFCVYAVQPNSTTNASSISFKVCSNGTVIEQNRVENSQIFELGVEPVTNWTIDSNKAYETASETPEALHWLEQHPDAKIELFYLNHMDFATWHIFWVDESEQNSGHLSVGIVASTGEVISVTEN